MATEGVNATGEILVVEDDPDLAEALCGLLEEKGYAVERSANGAEALARLSAPHPPSLVLLDLMMPVMDGWEFLAAKQRDPAAAPARVIVMSADQSAKARAVGADAFVGKPYDTRQLLETVASLLRAERGRQEDLRGLRLDQLTSLGRLAVGVAHEINNPLTWVAGNLALLEDELAALPDSPKVMDLRELVSGAIEGSARIARIVGGLKTLSRPDDDAVAAVELGPVLESALSLAGNELRHRARVVLMLDPGLVVMASSSRLTQLFLNLVLTAARRLPEGAAADHELTVSSRASGDRVLVEVRDSGTPFSGEAERHFVDGLGMSICRQLVAELGVQLQIVGSSGGSCLRVILPSAAPIPAVAPQAPAAEPGRARVLVIDDEPRIGVVLTRALGGEHDVTALTSAREALARVEAGERWDLILCDMMMPEMTGMELHAQLSARFPALAERMVFLTGGAFTPRAKAFLETVPNRHLDKPLDLARLRELARSTRGRGGDG